MCSRGGGAGEGRGESARVHPGGARLSRCTVPLVWDNRAGGRGAQGRALLLLAVVVCWFVACVALGAADVEPSAGRSRPAVAAEVWPRALF